MSGGFRYSAVSLKDIAAHFERIGNQHLDAASLAHNEKTRRAHLNQAVAWCGAADFINNCDLHSDSEVTS